MNYIAGQWRPGKRHFSSTSPTDGRALGEVVASSENDVSDAVAAARQALTSWRSVPVEKRAAIIDRVVNLLRTEYGAAGEVTPIKQLITDEMGKRPPEADIEVVESADMLAYFAVKGPLYLRDRELELDSSLWPTKKSLIRFEPRGVIGIIKPWNYPLEIPLWSIGAALIGGNTIVFKPSELSSRVGTRIVELFEKADLPGGVLNLVTGDGVTGKSIVQNPDVDMVSFTGSVPVGREIAVACAKRSCRASLELGGKDAMIVLEDAIPELAVNGALWGAFANCGQVCVGVRRLLVHESLYATLVPRLAEQARLLVLGRDIGPLVSKEHLQTVERHVADAISKGAKLVCGGRRIMDAGLAAGLYFEPTILENTTSEMLVDREDTFGPVLTVKRFKTDDEAVAIANGVRYDLGSSIWTQDRSRALRLADRIDSGMVWINDVNVAFPQAPWTGRKWSGHGIELSEFAFYEYVQAKHVNYDTSEDARRAWWFPYA